MKIKVGIKNYDGYCYVWFFKFDFQPNFTADIITFEQEYFPVKKAWDKAESQKQDTSSLKNPSDIILKDEDYYLVYYRKDQEGVINTFSWKKLQDNIQNVNRLNLTDNVTKIFKQEKLENDTFYGVYLIASNENPDIKSANFSDLKFSVFKTKGYRRVYNVNFGN